MGSRPGFTEAENVILRAAWIDHSKTIKDIQEALGRSRSGVQGQAIRLGLGMKVHLKANPKAGRWEESREAELRQHASQGLSWRAVAKLMGVSKNTVLSKAARLGLEKSASRPARSVKPKAAKVQTFGTNAGRPAKAHVPPEAAFTPLPDSSPRPWIEREPGQCRWPVGGEGADMLMCCRRAANNRYCGEHEAMALAPRNTASRPFVSYPRRQAA